ncbi:hypothetical protein P692DRAFT_20828782 [Suillus brevipes Sb2]|nr:hypothetical protein P692DRAFT_20828782 [Suillus brevipes Sb2]
MKENRHFNDPRIWLEAMVTPNAKRSVSRAKDCRYYLETTNEDMNTKALRLVRHWQCLDRLCRELTVQIGKWLSPINGNVLNTH